ncbi:hypothetical protein LV469_01240 [Peptoniphilus sp. GNH]|nr:hypothetical protein LV469_01240 [Peptoniphilus sp. GNH]
MENKEKMLEVIKSLEGISLTDWESIKKALDLYFAYKQKENAANIKIDDITKLRNYFQYR